MNRKSDKSKKICTMYHEGISVTEISRVLDCNRKTVLGHLERHYKEYFNLDYKSSWKKVKERDEKLFIKFNETYIPCTYTKIEICQLMECNTLEFDRMCNNYNLTYLRLKTYEGQRTLCNVPNENYDEYYKWAKEHNMSVRKLACIAINEYLLKEGK